MPISWTHANFALGDRAEEDARRSLGRYYAWLGDYAEQIIVGAAKDKDTLKTYLSAFEEAEADEVICFSELFGPRAGRASRGRSPLKRPAS